MSSGEGSKQAGQQEGYLQVFKKESDVINELLSKVLSKDDTFSDPNLNLTSNSMCRDYIFVLENSLHKHLKVELKDLSQNILLIPNGENASVKKAELCTLVTNHFKSILQVILLIKNVYDLEQVGNNSILGICVQLIKFDRDTFTIYFCDSPQSGTGGEKKKKSKHEEETVDLRELKGLNMLFEHFLDEAERKILVKNFIDIFSYEIRENSENSNKEKTELDKIVDSFGTQRLSHLSKLPPYEMEVSLKAKRNRKRYVDAMMCGDSLLSDEEYRDVFHHTSGSKVCNKVNAFNRRKQVENLKDTSRILISGRNPIFAPYCHSQRSHTIKMSELSATQATQLRQMYSVLRQDYIENMNVLYAVLKDIVVFDKKRNVFTLRNLSAQSLDNIRMKVKRLVIQFYMRSLINYQNILDYALSLNHV